MEFYRDGAAGLKFIIKVFCKDKNQDNNPDQHN